MTRRVLAFRARVPDVPEREAVGDRRPLEAFDTCTDPRIVFKDEEHDGTDRRMTRRLRLALERLAGLVAREWPGVRLRVTEAYDANREHSANSTHYEGRGADLTTWPIDGRKLGRLAGLAVEAGLDWVCFEDMRHVHASVRTTEGSPDGTQPEPPAPEAPA